MLVKNKTNLILLLLLIMLTYVLFYNIEIYNNSSKKTPIIIENVNCAFENNTCDIETREFKLKLILDKNIYYLMTFNIHAAMIIKNKSEIKDIYLSFNMVGMDMGINRFILKTDKPGTELQNWTGKGIIPFCVSGRADWNADLDIFTEKSQYRVSFPVKIMKKNN